MLAHPLDPAVHVHTVSCSLLYILHLIVPDKIQRNIWISQSRPGQSLQPAHTNILLAFLIPGAAELGLHKGEYIRETASALKGYTIMYIFLQSSVEQRRNEWKEREDKKPTCSLA